MDGQCGRHGQARRGLVRTCGLPPGIRTATSGKPHSSWTGPGVRLLWGGGWAPARGSQHTERDRQGKAATPATNSHRLTPTKGRESLPTLLALPGLPCLPCLLGKSRRRGRCGLRLWDGGGNYAASRSTLYSTPRALGCRWWTCSRRLAVRGFADAERFDRRDRRMAVLLFSQGNRLDQRY